MSFHFDDGTKVTYGIFGDSLDRMLDTALFFGSLKEDEAAKMSKLVIDNYTRDLTFDVSHAKKIGILLDTIPKKKVTFRGATLYPAELAVIATRRYPIDLSLVCARMDVDDFADHMLTRTAPFGSLSLGYFRVPENDLRRLFEHLHLFEHLQVNLLPTNDLLSKLLTSPIKSVGFDITETAGMDFTAVDIIPKRIELYLISSNAFPFRTGAMLSLLRRLTQLGHLESFKLDLCERCTVAGTPVPVDVKKALLEAVVSNKKLAALTLANTADALDSIVEELFNILEEHEGLRTLHLCKYPENLDPDLAWLLRLLKRNRRLQVTWDKKLKFEHKIDVIYALNRYFLWSERVKTQPSSIRSSLVGAALTHSALGDVERTGILLAHHMDVLCELLLQRETVCTSRAAEDGTAQVNMEN